jgi:hypothetical protein
MEYVRMKGPQGKGHAEVAVTKPPGCGADTPSSEPGVSFTDLWDSDFEDDDDDQPFRPRRMSDPSSTLNIFVRPWRHADKSRSESEGLDSFSGGGFCEVEAGDPRDDLDDLAYNPVWTMKGAMQTFHFWKESKRLQSAPLNAYLTYVSLPWFAIVRGKQTVVYMFSLLIYSRFCFLRCRCFGPSRGSYFDILNSSLTIYSMFKF